jgi:hypothetical protein
MKFYGLKVDGKPLGFEYASNDGGEFCCSVAFTLTNCPYNDNVWLVKDKLLAENACKNDVKWYNAGYESPSNPYAGGCQVFEVDI